MAYCTCDLGGSGALSAPKERNFRLQYGFHLALATVTDPFQIRPSDSMATTIGESEVEEVLTTAFVDLFDRYVGRIFGDQPVVRLVE